MYVCVCHAVRETDIQAAVHQGARSLDQLQDWLRVSTCCGTCEADAEACLSRLLAEPPNASLRLSAA
jgi:bacterioferritin-associated ferredoxin